ncbi:MAG: hypothetical protein EX341_06995 [Candidatus Scalindua sp. SCAELEC01]|nr:hypothetical protein [Planctomycetota bacterium]RZV88049.1 MAG: hypothetical protein EX341_06995 [Candidatus Scalindua sp. SCAELEC01]
MVKILSKRGGGIFMGLPIPPSGTVDLQNTIIGGNTNIFSNPDDCMSTGPGNVLISLDFNLDSDGTCNLAQPHDLHNPDPLLGPLQNNGGPPIRMPNWLGAL